jgi:hypothetical protein
MRRRRFSYEPLVWCEVPIRDTCRDRCAVWYSGSDLRISGLALCGQRPVHVLAHQHGDLIPFLSGQALANAVDHHQRQPPRVLYIVLRRKGHLMAVHTDHGMPAALLHARDRGTCEPVHRLHCGRSTLAQALVVDRLGAELQRRIAVAFCRHQQVEELRVVRANARQLTLGDVVRAQVCEVGLHLRYAGGGAGLPGGGHQGWRRVP